MKRTRSVVVENDQWVDVYTMPNGQVHIVYIAPYKLPTQYQTKLALKKAGVVLPEPPPLCQMTDEEKISRLSDHLAIDPGHVSDPRGLPEEYFHLGRWHVLYWSKQYRIRGPGLTARQQFEQKMHDNRFSGNLS